MEEFIKQVMTELELGTGDLEHLNGTISAIDFSDIKYGTKIVRIFRNACADQAKLALIKPSIRNDLLIQKVKEICASDQALDEAKLTFVRCCLQFWHNFCNTNDPGHLASDIIFCVGSCLNLSDSKVRKYASCLAMVLARNWDMSPKFPSNTVKALIKMAINEEDSDPSIVCIQVICRKDPEGIVTAYQDIDRESKFFILDVIYEEKQNLHERLVQFCCKLFQMQASTILTAGKSSFNYDPRETVRLLSIICELSTVDGWPKTTNLLQEDRSLLIDTVYLLRMMHDLGKSSSEPKSMFSPLQKVFEFDAVDPSEPTFQFKRDLVRLIGNLVWKNTKNQDLVRELEGIQLLLDCTPIDARNPFMTQWAIVALRYLCEKNEKNQSLLRGLDGKGNAVQLEIV